MAQINRIRLQQEINRQLKNMPKNAFIDQLNGKFDQAKKETLQEFDDHPVTQEMAAGPSADSQFLTTKTGGNLFSLLGFYANEHPEKDLRRSLEKGIHKGIITKTVKSDGTIVYTMVVKTPSVESLGKGAPILEWVNTSWIEAVENGVPGFTNYVFKLLNHFKNSRSGTAVQSKRPLRQGRCPRIPYMSKILENLRNRLK